MERFIKILEIIWSWPTLILILYFLLRDQIKELSSRLFSSEAGRAKFGAIEFEFGASSIQDQKEPSKLQPVVNQTIEGRSEVLDGKKYINCVFVKSTLIYKATASVSLEGCSFAEVGWIFEGPAERTMSFLRGLYHGAGEGGQQLVEKTFMSIKTLEPDKKIQPTATSGG